MLYLFFFKPLRDHLRGFLIAAWAGDKIAEFSFPEISFHFPLRPWFFFVSPAYAGKSRECARGLTRARNHPRVCGEKFRFCCSFLMQRGSPPRMRGKADGHRKARRRTRITPAYAGKRVCFRSQSRSVRDHPRVCGEKLWLFCCVSLPSGSPPRMRGKGWVMLTLTVRNGITPAYAGKRLKRSRSTVPPVAIVPLFPSVCNKPVVSDGSPAVRDAPLFLPAENAVPASPACNLRSL